MSRFRCRLMALAALVAIICFSVLVRADDEEDAPVKVDCSSVTSYPHLKDWDNDNAVDPNTIYLLDLYYSAAADTDGVVTALDAGLHAALAAGGYKTANNQPIVVVDIMRGSSSEDLPDTYIEEAVCRFGDRLFGVLGPFNDNRLRELLDTKILMNNTLVALGPYTGSSTVRFYTQNMYFMRADPVAELYAMLNYIINEKQHLRVGFAYVKNRNFGDEELVKTTEYVERVGSTMVGVYAGDGNNDDVDMESFQRLVDSAPKSIIVYSYPGTQTAKLLQLLLTSEELKNCLILLPSFLNYLLESAADAVEEKTDSNGVPLHSANRDRLFSTSTNYPAYATALHHIRQFRADMTAYIETNPNSPYDDPVILDDEPAFSEVMINGWIVGQMVFQVFDHESWVKSRETLMAGLFMQNRYVISEDFVLGDYGGACYSELVALQGAMCNCNQGGNNVFLLQHFANNSQRIVTDAVFSYSSTVCYAESVNLPQPVNMITLKYEGDYLFERINARLEVPAQLAVDSLNTFLVGTADTSYNIRAVQTTIEESQHDLDEYRTTHRVDIIVGAVLLGTDTADTLILSPMYRKPHATFTDVNKVVVRPTLEQQFYLACDFLASSASDHIYTSSSQMRVVLRDMDDENSDAIEETVAKTAETFRHKKPKLTKVAASTPLETALDANVVTFLMGMQKEDPPALVTYLEQSEKNCVLLLFQDLMLYYNELVEAFNATTDDVSGRLVFAASYPMWTDDSDEAYAQYPILKAFHEAMGDTQYYTPRAFEAYITVRLVEALASSLQDINAQSLREQLYHTSNFLIDDFRLGPFTDCNSSSIQDKNCVTRNYGASEVSLVSMRRIITPSQYKLFGPSTPAMTYSKRPLSTGEIVAIAVCCGVAVILMIVLPIVICMCCCSNSRDNKNAPKSAEDPVTIIFTDIESSTALWGTVPQIMPDAVATHHKIIRETIAAHKSYEVKTVGDSFMIACKKPFAAVQIAQDIQKRFLAHDWEEDIDECYRQFEQRKASDPDNEDYKPPSANLVRSVYDALWNGLRVRIGVHTGLSDIRQDEITGGFDYYGETSNMAARTEAIGNGGQVLLTDATWWALSQDERDSLDVTNLGRQGLRGVGYPVEMFQLNAVASRTFAALRLDIDAYLPNDDDTEGTMSTDGMSSSAATLTGPAAAIASVLTNCFSPYPPPRRIKELLPLLQKWGIPVPPRHRRVAEEDYCQGLLNRLALKMSSVVQIRSKMDGTAGSAPLRASLSTAVRSRDSRVTSVHGAANPLDGVGGLNAQAVAMVQQHTNNVSRRVSRRPSLRSGRLPVFLFSPLVSPTRSPRDSTTNVFEMTDVVPLPHAGGFNTSGSGTHWPTQPPPQSLLPRIPARHRNMGLAAHSMHSEMYQSVHVTMPDHVQ